MTILASVFMAKNLRTQIQPQFKDIFDNEI